MEEFKILAIGQDSPGNLDKLKNVSFIKPQLQPRELLVRVKAVSVNPIDFKKMKSGWLEPMINSEANPLIAGYDAAGTIEEVGNEVTFFKKGDHVFYAGDITKKGTNAQYHIVDERIVGHKPSSLSFSEAASFPLVGLTAWEGMVEIFQISGDKSKYQNKIILITAGAGGVGSVLIQLASKLFGLIVIATATRDESIQYCMELGAKYVIKHTNLKEELAKINIKEVDYIFHNWEMTQDSIKEFSEIIKPLGHIIGIAGFQKPLNLLGLFMKRVTVSIEMMFSRTFFNYQIEKQHDILEKCSGLLESKLLVHTMKSEKPFNLENLREENKNMMDGKNIGKHVLSNVDVYFDSLVNK